MSKFKFEKFEDITFESIYGKEAQRTRTVRDAFEEERIYSERVLLAADFSPYWSNASDLILDNWSKRIDDLSAKQKKWLFKCLEDLTEMRIEGKI